MFLSVVLPLSPCFWIICRTLNWFLNIGHNFNFEYDFSLNAAYNLNFALNLSYALFLLCFNHDLGLLMILLSPFIFLNTQGLFYVLTPPPPPRELGGAQSAKRPT